MSTKMELPVADLIDGDTILPKGHVVEGYPHGIAGSATLHGTMLPYRTTGGLLIWQYYGNSETLVTVIRD